MINETQANWSRKTLGKVIQRGIITESSLQKSDKDNLDFRRDATSR